MSLQDSFRAARWIRFTNLLLQAVLFLTLFAGLNYIALNHAWRFDLTQNRRHSLSPETRSYLEALKRDVKIIVTFTADSEDAEVAQAYRDISALLREYAYATRHHSTGRIEVEFLNIYQNRRRVEELDLDRPNVVMLVSEGHRRLLTISDLYTVKQKVRRESFKGEAALTAAILDVSSSGRKKIYFLAGHGELRPDDVDRVRGLSQLRDELRQRNFEIAGLDLSLTRRVPEDADLLIGAGPLKPFQPFEEELLRNFLSTRAGRLILMLDPQATHGLDNLLFDWGIMVYDNLIIDPNPDSVTDTGMRLWRFSPDPAPGSRITENLLNNDLSVVVGPTRVVSDDLGRSADDGLSVKKLIATSKDAWGEKSYRQKLFQYTPSEDLRGELSVMVISERLKPANNLPLSVRGGRLAVIGTSDLVTNHRIFTIGNLDLFLATVNWAAEPDIQVNVPVRPIQRFQLTLSQEELGRIRLGLFLGLPAIIALVGIVVYWTRRN
ncbi:MAG: GldG family protein [Opitutaceae bacterium]|nr:GldG family protein [Opitutaceae bacterium]